MSTPYGYAGPPGAYGPQFRPPAPVGSPGPYALPHPTSGMPVPPPVLVRRPLPRPGNVTMAATMAVVASLQWICALSFAWLVVTAGAQSLETSEAGSQGALFHLLNRFNYRLLNGLAWPLYGFPLAAFFLGFAVLAPRTWTRWALTLTGLAALGWSAWWLREDFVWWLPSGLYVIVACLLLWTPGATAWYRARGRPV